MRPADFRPGARQIEPAEGLSANDGADHIAIDITIAGQPPAQNTIDRDVDSRMHTQGQPEPAGLDRIEQTIELGRLETHDMENWTKNLAFQIAHVGNFENVRRDIKPARRSARRNLARE